MKYNTFVQICLPTLTVLGFLLVSLKLSQYGLIVSLISQIFWFYSSYKAWKNAGQIGAFLTTIFITAKFLVSSIIGFYSSFYLIIVKKLND